VKEVLKHPVLHNGIWAPQMLLHSSVNTTFLLEGKSTPSRALLRVSLFEVEMGDKNPNFPFILFFVSFLCFFLFFNFFFFQNPSTTEAKGKSERKKWLNGI
jgi:hypothetical protein